MTRPKQNGRKLIGQKETGPIRTTFMELIEVLTNLTRDDALVLAAVRNIFGTYRVRFAHTMAPVRLVSAQGSTMRNTNHRAQRVPTWA